MIISIINKEGSNIDDKDLIFINKLLGPYNYNVITNIEEYNFYNKELIEAHHFYNKELSKMYNKYINDDIFKISYESINSTTLLKEIIFNKMIFIFLSVFIFYIMGHP